MVEGRVQGVWFRASTMERANQLGVTGWAQNCPDGRVEVMMCGEVTAVELLSEWLHEGPPLAVVKKVEVEECGMQTFDGFTTG